MYISRESLLKLSLLIFFFFFGFLGPHPRHMEVPRLGVQSELELLAYTTATATWDPSHVCNLHHSSRQRRILNPLRVRPGIEPTTSWFLVRFVDYCATTGTPVFFFFDQGKNALHILLFFFLCITHCSAPQFFFTQHCIKAFVPDHHTLPLLCTSPVQAGPTIHVSPNLSTSCLFPVVCGHESFSLWIFIHLQGPRFLEE